jgi:hypothetical protein
MAIPRATLIPDPSVDAGHPHTSDFAYLLQVVDTAPPDERDALRRRVLSLVAGAPMPVARLVQPIDLPIASAPPDPDRRQHPAQLDDVRTARARALWTLLCSAVSGRLPPHDDVDMTPLCGQIDWKSGKN